MWQGWLHPVDDEILTKVHLHPLARDPLAHLFLPSSPSHFQTFREEGLLQVCKVEHHKAKKAQFCSWLCKAAICPLVSQRTKRNFYLWLQKTWKKWRMWIFPNASDSVLGRGKRKEVIKQIVSSAFSSRPSSYYQGPCCSTLCFQVGRRTASQKRWDLSLRCQIVKLSLFVLDSQTFEQDWCRTEGKANERRNEGLGKAKAEELMGT